MLLHIITSILIMGGNAFVCSFPRHRTSYNAIHTLLTRRNRHQHQHHRVLRTPTHHLQPSTSFIHVEDHFQQHARSYYTQTATCLGGITNSDAYDDAPISTTTISSNNTRDQRNEQEKARQIRKERLHHHLSKAGINTAALSTAAHRSVTTTEGFDPQFGKSAIKAYRSYLDPKPGKLDSILRENADVSSNRYARQIDFLAKRHRSREAEWVRHTDAADDGDDDDDRVTFPLVLVLDNLRSAANVGSIYRSAEAAGCALVLTAGITPHPNGNGAEKLAKSALGAERMVDSMHFATTSDALEYLRECRPGLCLVGMETTERSRIYTEFKYPGPGVGKEEDDGEVVESATTENSTTENSTTAAGDSIISSKGVALFLGNEVSGVDTEIMPLLDEVVEIPMFGKKNSLNVAACAPVVMYEILRQWGVSSSSSS